MVYSSIYCWILLLSFSAMLLLCDRSRCDQVKYNVFVSLHEAREPAAIKVSIEGPSYNVEHVVFVQPYGTTKVEFLAPKLLDGNYKLIAEGISGIVFRNESRLNVKMNAGPKIYIQTDKAIYKPGDVVQFRVLFMDEHTRPLQIREPIRVEIIDGKENRVKQFKGISLVKGIYKGNFQLSEYPVLGVWQIRVYISGAYDFTKTKIIKVQHYVLPKFSVYIKMNPHFVPEDRLLKILIYGKYTFDKYVEGNITATLTESYSGAPIQQKQQFVKDQLQLEFYFDKPEELKHVVNMNLKVDLKEKQTDQIQSDSQNIFIHHQKYNIFVDTNSIRYHDSRPYRLKASVQFWNGTNVSDRSTSVKMSHGAKDYESYLDGNGEATFEFDHDETAKHIFSFKDSTYTMPNLYANEKVSRNTTDSYCTLKLKGDKPRLGTPIEIEVTSIESIPYLVYSIVAHANIIQTQNVPLPPNQKSYTIRIIPSIEIVPLAFLYVHYVNNGIFHYEEIKLEFPWEFENKITVVAPKQVEPGEEVTLDLKAQPGSYVGVLAVDLGVYLLDSSYDLKRGQILDDLQKDMTYLPFPALVYPGLLSGVVTFTNADYEYVPLSGFGVVLGAGAANIKFRNKFPETWIFENYEITNESTKLTLHIPDTITTWRITAFTMHDITGFGIVDGPTDVTTIQPFFINLNLPYSVKRGEIVAIPVIIYNYHNQLLDTEITFYNPNRIFEFMVSNFFAGFRISHHEYHIQRVIVPANGIESVKFYIYAKQVGELNLKIVARNSLASDAIIQKLKVEPEGTIRHHNTPLHISVQPGETFNTTLPLNIPSDVVPHSEFITLSMSGNSLAPTLKNLNSLVLLPTGCGEQNMVNFAPNILVLQYLRTSGNYLKQAEVVTKAKKYIDIGYQQQLSYRHANGGYSVFGQRTDDEPSTWLTAYVIRFFIKATKFLAIEGHILDSGLEYLSQNQLPDGSFIYTGYLFYPAQQNRYGFTAFVLMTFLEQRTYATKYQNTIQKGLQFLSNNLNKVSDTYALSIMAATLQMAQHQNAKQILDKLQQQRQSSSHTVWWTQGDSNPEKDVEITAYILMAMLDSNDRNSQDVQSIFKWLTEQRNERGGFKSTHDTVVGLQALVKFSEKYTEAANMNLKLNYKAKDKGNNIIKSGELTVDANNMLILQTEELLKFTRSIDIAATGIGNSLVQLSYCYHVVNNDTFKHFHMETHPSMRNSEELLLNICFTYRQPAAKVSGGASTNMIIMEANLPSGFTSSDEFNNDLLDNEIVERIESKNEETTLVIYFEKIAENVQNCFDIFASKMHEIAMRKPASITIYDYYNISRHDTEFYSI